MLAASQQPGEPHIKEIRARTIAALRKTGIDETLIGVALTIVEEGNTQEEDNRLGGRHHRTLQELRTQAREILMEAAQLRTKQLWSDMLDDLSHRRVEKAGPQESQLLLRGGTIIISWGENDKTQDPSAFCGTPTITLKGGRATQKITLDEKTLATAPERQLRKLYHELKVFQMSDEVPADPREMKGKDFLLKSSGGKEVVFRTSFVDTAEEKIIGDTYEWWKNRLRRVKRADIMRLSEFRKRVLKTVDLRGSKARQSILFLSQPGPTEQSEVTKLPKPIDAQKTTYFIDALTLLMNPSAPMIDSVRFENFLTINWFPQFTNAQVHNLAGLFLIFGQNLEGLIHRHPQKNIYDSPHAQEEAKREICRQIGIPDEELSLAELQTILKHHASALMDQGQLLPGRKKPRSHEDHLIARQRAQYLAYSLNLAGAYQEMRNHRPGPMYVNPTTPS